MTQQELKGNTYQVTSSNPNTFPSPFEITRIGTSKTGRKYVQGVNGSMQVTFFQRDDGQWKSETTDILTVVAISVEPEVISPAKRTPHKPKAKKSPSELTGMQYDFLRVLGSNPSTDNGTCSVWWIDVLADDMQAYGFGHMTTGAMITTLREKGIVTTATGMASGVKRMRKACTMELTEFGRKIVEIIWGE